MAKKKRFVYVCEGSCGAIVSPRRYKAGLKKCGAESCGMHNRAFRKKQVID
ncbi:TPA: hypothetical protein HA243_02760 [Candidatus Micrarchaeota archaeon]|nr:hypothetical protein [Candidatus Micrarchaeota archaeon]